MRRPHAAAAPYDLPRYPLPLDQAVLRRLRGPARASRRLHRPRRARRCSRPLDAAFARGAWLFVCGNGGSAALATVNIHVDGDNYGVIEDTHQSIMHMLSQYLRQAKMAEALIVERKF